MTHTPPQPATAATAVAIGLAKDSELLHSLLQLLWLCSLSLFFFFLFLSTYALYLCLFWSVSLIMWRELSGDTRANNTPGEEKKRSSSV